MGVEEGYYDELEAEVERLRVLVGDENQPGWDQCSRGEAIRQATALHVSTLEWIDRFEALKAEHERTNGVGAPIVGYCPMGCGQSLVREATGMIRCTNENCPKPAAAHRILGDEETEHVMEFTETGFTVRHPLRERLDGDLFLCPVHAMHAEMPKPEQIVEDGQYRVTERKGSHWAPGVSPYVYEQL